MPTTYTHAVQITAAGAGGNVNLGSNAAFDNMTAFTVGLLVYSDSAVLTAGRLLSKMASGWSVQAASSTIVDNTWTRTTANNVIRYASSLNNTAKWNWLFVTFDQSNSTTPFTVRSGLYGGTLATRSGAVQTAGSGTFTDDSASSMRLFNADIAGARFVPIAFVGVWPSVLSTGTIDSYASDMDGNGGLTAATDYIKFDASMATSATSGKGLMTGTYTNISLVNGPDVSVAPFRPYYITG